MKADLIRALRGRGLTQLEALQRFGCGRLAARVWELKREGYRIVSDREPVETRHGTAYVSHYRIAQ